ncbi:hypothetical protein Ctob_015567, partial [Chrysochromulina tobinii]
MDAAPRSAEDVLVEEGGGSEATVVSFDEWPDANVVEETIESWLARLRPSPSDLAAGAAMIASQELYEHRRMLRYVGERSASRMLGEKVGVPPGRDPSVDAAWLYLADPDRRPEYERRAEQAGRAVPPERRADVMRWIAELLTPRGLRRLRALAQELWVHAGSPCSSATGQPITAANVNWSACWACEVHVAGCLLFILVRSMIDKKVVPPSPAMCPITLEMADKSDFRAGIRSRQWSSIHPCMHWCGREVLVRWTADPKNYSQLFGSASLPIHIRRCRDRTCIALDACGLVEPSSPTASNPSSPSSPSAPVLLDEAEALAHAQTLKPCCKCGRTFAPDRLAVHERVCLAGRRSRKASSPTPRTPRSRAWERPRPASKWRQQHEELQAIARAHRRRRPSTTARVGSRQRMLWQHMQQSMRTTGAAPWSVLSPSRPASQSAELSCPRSGSPTRRLSAAERHAI